MVSGGVSQGKVISNIDASEKWILNTIVTVAAQDYCSAVNFAWRQKEPLFQVTKVRRFLVLKIQKNILADVCGVHVYVAIFYYI